MADTTSNTAQRTNSRAPRTTVHTPLIRLQAARRHFVAAQEACPHWDFESGGEGHGCCLELDSARRELGAARKAVRP